MALAKCPECGADLSGLSAEELIAHRHDHWDTGLDRDQKRSSEAQQRIAQLDEEIAARQHSERESQTTSRTRKAD